MPELNDINIRALQPGDMQKIASLLATRDELEPGEAEIRTNLMRWLAFENPFANGEATYFVAESAGEIIAYHGRMPVVFNYRGRNVKGYYVHDLYVHPQSRKKGLGFWLTMALAKAIEEASQSFFCLFGMTKLNRAMQKRRGYFEIPARLDVYQKTLRPKKELQRWLKLSALVRLVLPSATGLLFLLDKALFFFHGRGVQVEEIDRFDERFDRLHENIRHKLGVAILKSSAYLNWKYIDRPCKRETVFAATKDGRLTGFVVVSMTPYRKKFALGIILDLVADPADAATAAALCKAASAFFRRKKADRIAFMMTDARFGAVLKKLLFVKKAGDNAMMLGHLEKSGDLQSVLKDAGQWHLTFSESDAFMLSP